MNKKQLLVLTSIAGILIILLITKLLWQNYQSNQVYPLQQAFHSVKSNTVNKLFLKNGSHQLSIAKQNTSWRVNGFPADPEKIGAFLANVTSMQVTGIASSEQSSWSSLNISPDKATQVTMSIHNAQQPPTLFISSDGSVVRENTESTVYSLANPITISVDEKSWEDVTMLHIYNTSDIISFTLTDVNGNTSIFTKSNNGWILNGNQIADSKISPILQNFLTLTADHLLAKADASAFTQNAGSLQLVLSVRSAKNKSNTSSTKTITFSVFGPQNNEYLVTKSGDSRYFIIESSSLQQLLPSSDTGTS